MSTTIVPQNNIRRRRRRRLRWQPYAYILPSAFLLFAVYFLPMFNAVRYSFTDADMIAGVGKWVGLKNYIDLFKPEFGWVLWRTLLWLVIGVGGSMVLGVLMALLLEKALPGRTIFRVILTLPWIFPDSIAAIMWKFTLHPGWGMVNSVLGHLHIVKEPINFFSPETALWAVIAIRIWKGAPFIFLAVLAGLQAIPREVEEAGCVDGATAWQRLIYLKLPMLKPVLWASGTILAAWTLVIFDLVYVLTAGGPLGSTEILSITIYDAGFYDGQVGAASALSMIAIAVLAIFSYFYVRREMRAGLA
jgi:multiple sugar transport system permease protein